MHREIIINVDIALRRRFICKSLDIHSGAVHDP